MSGRECTVLKLRTEARLKMYAAVHVAKLSGPPGLRCTMLQQLLPLSPPRRGRCCLIARKSAAVYERFHCRCGTFINQKLE